MRIFNSLTRKIEEFEPIHPPLVKIYTCGPTVYNYPTIGNWRTYVMSDLLIRSLKYLGYKVEFVMNLTDVGHLTGDNLGDADRGEDRLEKAAKKERKTAWEIAEFYSKDFLDSFDKLNLTKPMVFAKATEHIDEQIKLVEKIEKAGFVYRTSDGVYFDVAKYEATGNTYGELSNLDEIKEGARVEVNPEKKDKRDFALWKFSPADKKRDMEWESPWGVGFPGWHIECSAMSMKYLGERLDVHCGGEDLKGTHHPNEIAQSEAATGKKPFSKYWVHGAFLLVDGGRMGKSLGNAYTLSDIENKGFSPLDLRYFYLTGHYRKQINFTWEALNAAQTALGRLKAEVLRFKEEENMKGERIRVEGENDFENKFRMAIEDDLNLPQALAVVWELVKSDYPDRAKKASLLKFDEVLGLNLGYKDEGIRYKDEGIKQKLEERESLRRKKRFEEADKIREELEGLGYKVVDRAGDDKLKE